MNYEDRVTKTYIENAIANAGAKIAGATYVGDGAAERTFNLGFTPKVVYTCLNNGTSHLGNDNFGGLAIANYPAVVPDADDFVLIEIVEGGFTVHNGLVNNQCCYTNIENWSYRYVAIG